MKIVNNNIWKLILGLSLTACTTNVYETVAAAEETNIEESTEVDADTPDADTTPSISATAKAPDAAPEASKFDAETDAEAEADVEQEPDADIPDGNFNEAGINCGENKVPESSQQTCYSCYENALYRYCMEPYYELFGNTENDVVWILCESECPAMSQLYNCENKPPPSSNYNTILDPNITCNQCIGYYTWAFMCLNGKDQKTAAFEAMGMCSFYAICEICD